MGKVLQSHISLGTKPQEQVTFSVSDDGMRGKGETDSGAARSNIDCVACSMRFGGIYSPVKHLTYRFAISLPAYLGAKR